MLFVYYVFLVNGILAVLVNCQGGGGGGGGGRGGGGGGGGNDRGNCTAPEVCKIVRYSISGTISGGIVLIVCFYFCHRCCAGRPLRSNRTFVTLGIRTRRQKIENDKIFRSGFWTTRYFQYKWRGIHRLSLLFDQQKLEVTGSGSDDIGIFICYGTYSVNLGRMGLAKVYLPSTGDPFKNLGHTVIIQLTWNANEDQFEGKWYMRTSKYRGEGYVELGFDEINRNNIQKV